MNILPWNFSLQKRVVILKMLKWAVNGSKQSYLPTVGEYVSMHQQSSGYTGASRRSLNSLIGKDVAVCTNVECRRLRRKSSDICSLRRKVRSEDKENQLTSTPLPVSMRRSCSASPSYKLGGFKDLSNIAPDIVSGSPMFKQTRQYNRVAPTLGVQSNQILRSVPANYASTLPTFDVEYSPCGQVPGPALAFRGIGIADTYFEKPRYLTQEFHELNRRCEKFETCSAAGTKVEQGNQVVKEEEFSLLSSSKMGDMTLERMIDAILESAHKERKVLKSSKQAACLPVMSPTYAPADDPASDLHEFWDLASNQYQQRVRRMTSAAATFNEREVRSPLATHFKKLRKHKNDVFRLRRQRAVRRKRKMTGSAGLQGLDVKGLDPFAAQGEDRVDKQVRNVSPDSGRNSSSDYEDDCVTLNVENKSCNHLDGTKRRLSFSINDLLEH